MVEKSTIVSEVREKFNGAAGACAMPWFSSVASRRVLDPALRQSLPKINQPLGLLFEVAAVARQVW